MSAALQLAFHEYGQAEIPGPTHNLRIVRYAEEIDLNWVKDDETAWCAIFAHCMNKRAGRQWLSSAWARSFLTVGIATDEPRPGDMVVFWRGSPSSDKGHVAFFLGFDATGKYVFVLGGNQRNRVSIEAYPVHQVIAYRRLGELTGLPGLPSPTLQYDDRNKRVKALQQNLNALGFPCGRADGHYGQLTQAAVSTAQHKAGQRKTGVYTQLVFNRLQSMLQA